jgi:hypothetical protein
MQPTRDFNEYVNMTVDELEEWLKSDSSQSTGWSKDDGSGESVGHERYISSISDSLQSDGDSTYSTLKLVAERSLKF